ncbi:MAG: hypothetical protein KME05_20510 [Gloeocapsa sp. UFS-A4-WI-NPMV-4B04]|nr:hypothetical protein [Gloeocapsa sp. UFS-A4-WI-NPMV-4B04]
MSAHKTSVGYLLEGVIHFLKVTASYWSGLFHCYSVPGLPRTNNDLEHIFGTTSGKFPAIWRIEADIPKLSAYPL